MNIFFVEDNVDFREEISFQLEAIGHCVQPFGSAEAFLQGLANEPMPDAVLLDLGLPDRDGTELARHLRTYYPGLLIVMLTARGALNDRVDGWNAGADAYLTKPVHLAELRAVLESLSARQRESAAGDTSAWVLDLVGHTLTSPDGESVDVTHSEQILLVELCRSVGTPVEREQLVTALGHELWAYDMRRLETAMSRLRKKLSELGADSAMLRPARGVGYLLTVDVVVQGQP